MTLKTVLVVWVSCEQNHLQMPPTQRRHLDLPGVCFAFWGRGAGMCEMMWWITCCYTVCWSIDLHNRYTHTHTHRPGPWDRASQNICIILVQWIWEVFLCLAAALSALSSSGRISGPPGSPVWSLNQVRSIEILRNGFWWRCRTISELIKRKGRDLNLSFLKFWLWAVDWGVKKREFLWF